MRKLRWLGSLFAVVSLAFTPCHSQTPVAALVAIFSTLPDTRIGVGTGSFISSDGKVLTAFHVVDDAKSLEITYAGKPYTSITVLAVDPDDDLALLKINDSDLHPTYIDLATSAPDFVGGEAVTIYGHSAQVFNQTIPGTISRNLGHDHSSFIRTYGPPLITSHRLKALHISRPLYRSSSVSEIRPKYSFRRSNLLMLSPSRRKSCSPHYERKQSRSPTVPSG